MDQTELATETAAVDPTRDAPSGITVHVDPERNPLLAMSQQDRMRLFIRVLCELVAYEEADATRTPGVTETR